MQTEMKQQTEINKAIVTRFVNEYQTNGREETADEILSDKFIEHTPFPGFTPDKSGVKQLFTFFRSVFEDFRAEIFDQVAEGNKVVTRKCFYGKHIGEFMGIAPTNRDVKINLIDIVIVENGQVTEHWNQVDVAGLMAQITK